MESNGNVGVNEVVLQNFAWWKCTYTICKRNSDDPTTHRSRLFKRRTAALCSLGLHRTGDRRTIPL